MKMIIILALSLISLSASAKDIKVQCSVFHNLEEVFQNEITVADGAKNISIGDFDLFEMFMSSLPDGRYELQMLNSMQPSRSYATGSLSQSSPTLELTVWTREFILETKCKLIE